MAYVIGFLLALLSVIILAYPFLKARLRATVGREVSKAEELARARQAIFDEMGRLKLDLDVNNITQEEYQQRMAGLRRNAAVNLRRKEELGAKAGRDEAETLEELDRKVEERIMLLRRSRRTRNGTRACPECGQHLEVEDVACPQCGTAIASGSSSQRENLR